MRLTRQGLLVLLLAILGIALAAAITFGTSQLVRQRIGLASEPLSAGRRLLPQVTHVNPVAKGRPTSTTGGAQPSRRPTSRPSTTPPPSTRATTTGTAAPAPHEVQQGGSAEPGPSSGSPQTSDGGDSSSHRDD